MTEVITETDGVSADEIAAIEHAVDFALAFEGAAGGICVTVTDDDAMHCMNRDFRGVDRTTDVLSFPSREGDQLIAPGDGLGDIAISYPRAKAQSEEYGHSLIRELSFLAVHGTLHILGYDHIDDCDRAEMEARQKQIMDEMGVTR